MATLVCLSKRAQCPSPPKEFVNARRSGMNRLGILAIVGVLSVGTAAAQSEKDLQAGNQSTASSQPSNQQETNALPSGAPIAAALTKSLDSKKVKKGDEVTARITEATKENGKTLIPAGAKLEGHVTQASARSKGDSFSTLGIVFDKAVLKDGQEVPLNVTVQAIAAAPNSAPQSNSPSTPMEPMGGAAPSGGAPRMNGGGATGGMTSAPPVTPSPGVTSTVPNASTKNGDAGKGAGRGLNQEGQLTSDSRGIFGLQGIALAVATTDSQQAAVITSTDKNVHLDSGTQLLLVTQAATSAQPPKS
jgi:hypothetical protein